MYGPTNLISHDDVVPVFGDQSLMMDGYDYGIQEITIEDWRKLSDLWKGEPIENANNNNNTTTTNNNNNTHSIPPLLDPLPLVRGASEGLKSIVSLNQSHRSLEHMIQLDSDLPEWPIDSTYVSPPFNVPSMDKLGDFWQVKNLDSCDLPKVITCSPSPDPAPSSSSHVVKEITRLMKQHKEKEKETNITKKKAKQQTTPKHKQKPSKIQFVDIKHISSKDVYCERGGRANNHAGNHHFLKEAHKRQTSYKSPNTTKAGKSKIARELLAHIKSENGRFLKCVENDKSRTKYYVVTDALARRKCSQALREYKGSR